MEIKVEQGIIGVVKTEAENAATEAAWREWYRANCRDCGSSVGLVQYDTSYALCDRCRAKAKR